MSENLKKQLESTLKAFESLSNIPKIEVPQIQFPEIPNVGDVSPIHKVIYEVVSGKFIETPTRTTMSQAIRIHLVYYRRCNA